MDWMKNKLTTKPVFSLASDVMSGLKGPERSTRGQWYSSFRCWPKYIFLRPTPRKAFIQYEFIHTSNVLGPGGIVMSKSLPFKKC